MAEITLTDALEGIKSKLANTRKNGLADLKHIVRHNQNGSLARNLDNKSFHTIFDALFQCALDERSAMVKSKSQSAKTSAINRLIDTAAALRLSVEAGVHVLQVGTVRAVVDHVFDTIYQASGDICEPLALDYAKCLRALFRYQPHLEHFPPEYWEQCVAHTLDCIKKVVDDTVDNGEAASTIESVAGTSYRSSRSHMTASQDTRLAIKQLSEEMVACLQLLLTIPTTPMKAKGRDIGWTLIEFLRTAGVTSRALPDAFAAINRLLSWSRTNNVALTQDITSHLVRLVRELWSPKSLATTQMLITLLLLRPYLFHAVMSTAAPTLHADLAGLLQVMQTDYGGRQERDSQKQLALDDIRLETSPSVHSEPGHVAVSLFSLRNSGPRSESNWLQVYLMASLYHVLISSTHQRGDPYPEQEQPDAEPSAGRPRKRQRLQDHFTSLIEDIQSDKAPARTCALQVLAFLIQQKPMSVSQVKKICDAVIPRCSDDNANTATWAFLAMTACITQTVTADSEVIGRCATFWQLATRSLSSLTSCRTAAYALSIMLQLQAVAQANVTELAQSLAEAMDLNGPSQLSEAVSDLLRSLLRTASQLGPGTSSQLADSVLVWLSRAFTPSKIDDRAYASASISYEAADVSSLVCECLGQTPHAHRAIGFRVWDAAARSWISCGNEKSLVSYLLLSNPDDLGLHSRLETASSLPPVIAGLPSTSCEALLLTYMSNELLRMGSAWTTSEQDRHRHLSYDSYTMLCKASQVFICISNCMVLRDLRRQSQAQEQAAKLLNEVSQFMFTTIDDAKADAYLSIMSSAFTTSVSTERDLPHEAPVCEKVICSAVALACSQRDVAKDYAANGDVDLDDQFDSQESRTNQAPIGNIELCSDFDVSFSRVALRSCSSLYARVRTSLDRALSSEQEPDYASTEVVDDLLSREDSQLLASRNVIKLLPSLGLTLSVDDADRLLDYFMTDLLSKYAIRRSEVLFGTVLDVLESQTSLWATPANGTLYKLGLDAYEWFTDVAVPARLLSPTAQKRLAILLCRLCDLDFEYSDHGISISVSNNLFTLMQQGEVNLQFILADRVSAIFGRFVLSEHQKIFEDFLSKLPADFQWMEGMAMRLLFLSKLGARWHSLLRHCVYYIFETAGRNKSSLHHATHCIAELSEELPLDSPRRLFSLFAPQLLLTWQATKEPLTKLPYAAFQYSSLAEILKTNESEICAQLAIQGTDEDLQTVCNVLKVLPSDLYKRSFAKCLAYAIGWDVAHHEADKVSTETKLREAIGGKTQAKGLIQDQWPTILGYVFLMVQQDDPEDQWLQGHTGYDNAKRSLTEIKSYSYSARQLPPCQQPSIRSRFLLDQIERLSRRINQQEPPWSASSFTLTARMLLDTIDKSMGSLHSALMVRRIRTLVCLAGPVAYRGFALEMLIHSLRPLVEDSECADDSIGLLQYLLHHGETQLKTNYSFLGGTVMLLILQIRRYSQEKQARSSQGSQHSATVHKMESFQKWLVDFLQRTLPEKRRSENMRLANALGSLHLPGNGHRDSPESFLLLFVIDQWYEEKLFCSKADAMEALKLLSSGFEAPTSVWTDCLGDDVAAVKYSQPLWEIMRATTLDQRFTAWAAQVLGRAYIATGIRPTQLKRQSGFVQRQVEKAQGNNSMVSSQAIIAEHWSNLLLARDRLEAGLAEHCLRKFLMTENSDREITVPFEQMLPEQLYEATSYGTFWYEPPLSAQSSVKADDKALRDVLVSFFPATTDWVKSLATIVCRWAANLPLIANLALLVQHVDGLASDLLPSILHILLVKELESGRTTLREVLSSSVAACLSEEDSSYNPRQRLYLGLLLYLRSQPYPGEATRADRLKWLDVDYLLAADAGSRCGLPTCALLLAESAAPAATAHASRRSSTRNTLSQLGPAEPSAEMLLSIYQQLEEPDSFYGVPQPASLESVLHRLDHETDGFRSLMFRSAQMDSHMRLSKARSSSVAAGLMHSLSSLSFNSLTFSLLKQGLDGSVRTTQEMTSAAQALQQWDIALPESTKQVSTFTVFQDLSRASDLQQTKHKLQLAIVDHTLSGIGNIQSDVPSHSWHNTLGSLTEIMEVLSSTNHEELQSRWRIMQAREEWMRLARYTQVQPILSSRHTLFGVLRDKPTIQHELNTTSKYCHALEAEALLHNSRLARGHSQLQDALTATTSLHDMSTEYLSLNLSIGAAVKLETACVLWDAGESTASVKMLQDIVSLSDVDKQDLPVGKAGVHAQLAQQLAEARLEKPEDILAKYLRPAINHLKGGTDKQEAGRVYYEFASFCDHELSNPGNIENLARVVKLRQDKEEEVDAITLAIKNAKKTGDDKHELQKAYTRAKTWLELDSGEEKRLKDDRISFTLQSLQNYLLALQFTDEHDICVLRFFALWLENADNNEANGVVLQYLRDVPSWKFVLLMNQLMSRVEVAASTFQTALQELLLRIFKSHPHQSIHHLYASSRPVSSNDPAAMSRYNAARGVHSELRKDAQRRDLIDRIWKAAHWYQNLAEVSPELKPNTSKCRLKDVAEANKIAAEVKELSLPPVTLSVPLRPGGDYRDVPVVRRVEDRVLIMNGISHPKVLTVLASDGRYHKQLFKGGNDDLRQDAIMEQVFEEVSKMLRNHKATRQRDLKVRTYKVIPLSTGSGIIEFVPSSIPINDFLRPAHKKYYPSDYDEGKARSIIYNAQTHTLDQRVKEFRRVCAHLHPVLRHFFLERFDDPDEWFERRTAYTRTTASISILGHILGLGDRHNSNILLDEKTGEVVHIDLGVAFEAGRVLPIPEKVPFRLTRDVVDGMGVTKTEGVFRRCCEFTLDAVREDKESIMTLLNVLRYDPLYSWSLSPLRAKRMQEAQELSRNAGLEEVDSSKRREQEAGEADRALSIVERKMSKTLSTQAAVNELIQQATDEKNLATLFQGWGAFW